MIIWPANPFTHLGADLADVLSMKLSAVEMIRMDVTHSQLVTNGMTGRTESMFRFNEEVNHPPCVRRPVGSDPPLPTAGMGNDGQDTTCEVIG